MTARILVVDDIEANVRLLEAKLHGRILRGADRATTGRPRWPWPPPSSPTSCCWT